ncbi:hypothetical protein C2E23DRAFT_215327 [Lenzites betulinus]|nr:hypothetical protein C2E23DRAFT_215327 [Lenzites betulinus]
MVGSGLPPNKQIIKNINHFTHGSRHAASRPPPKMRQGTPPKEPPIFSPPARIELSRTPPKRPPRRRPPCPRIRGTYRATPVMYGERRDVPCRAEGC